MSTHLQPVPLLNNCLFFNRQNFKRTYSVEVIIDIEDKTPQAITYNVTISYGVNSLGRSIAEVVTVGFLVNHREPQSILEEIAVKCREALSRCVFEINVRNEIIGIENYFEILLEWKDVKNQLLIENTGDIAERYLDMFEASLIDADVLLTKLRKDSFIGNYFSPIYNAPYHGYKRTFSENFTFFNVEYDEDLILEIREDGNFDEYGHATVIKRLSDPYNYERLIPIEVYEAKYTLDNSLAIRRIDGVFLNYGKRYLFTIEQTGNNDDN